VLRFTAGPRAAFCHPMMLEASGVACGARALPDPRPRPAHDQDGRDEQTSRPKPGAHTAGVRIASVRHVCEGGEG